MMKRNLFVCVVLLSLFFSSCEKDPLKNLTDEESRIYITNYDTTVSFSSFSSFRLADSVATISNNQYRGRSLSSNDAQFVSAVASALQQRGYTKTTANPDLGVTITAISNTSSQVVSYTDYGGYYGGYWDPYYWGYPSYSYYFPTYYGVYESTETALSVDIVDLKHASGSNQLKVIWSGLIRGSGIFSGQNISSQIAALFDQSPYLKK